MLKLNLVFNFETMWSLSKT